jgi:hypothetical protein
MVTRPFVNRRDTAAAVRHARAMNNTNPQALLPQG